MTVPRGEAAMQEQGTQRAVISVLAALGARFQK